MKQSCYQFIYACERLITSAALAATLIFAPGAAFATDKVTHTDHTELRIKCKIAHHLHTYCCKTCTPLALLIAQR
jgi:hypothetical protein